VVVASSHSCGRAADLMRPSRGLVPRDQPELHPHPSHEVVGMQLIDRRYFLRGGLLVAAGAALTACSEAASAPRGPGFVRPDGEQVRAAEAARKPGVVRDFVVTAERGMVDLGGKTVDTWSYDGQ